VLETDFLKAQKSSPTKKIYFKVKKKAVRSWKELSLIWKVVYVIEAPMKFLV
jgi:hypothetical protein